VPVAVASAAIRVSAAYVPTFGREAAEHRLNALGIAADAIDRLEAGAPEEIEVVA
jgi:hypothetical protein